MSQLAKIKPLNTRFRISDSEMRKQIRILQQPSVLRSIGAFLEEWAVILGVSCISCLVFLDNGMQLWTVTVYILAVFLISIRMRALENLIHEAVHGNLCHNRQLNDGMAWVFAALPLGHSLSEERSKHCSGHHQHFWVRERDPDYQRYVMMGIDTLPAKNFRALLEKCFAAFPVYLVGLVQTFYFPSGESTKILLCRMCFWISVVTLFWWKHLIIFLVSYWLIPFLTGMSLIRFIGEISEHAAFTCSNNELVTTRNNLGWFNEHIIHPRGDGYHLVHHLFPKIPFFRLKKAHQLLMKDMRYCHKGIHAQSFIFKRNGNAETTIGGLIKDNKCEIDRLPT